MATKRVTMTIPADLLEWTDERAAEEGRSRSSIVADALREQLRRTSGIVREASPVYAPGLGKTRLAQLAADVALSADERVVLAEDSALVAGLARPRVRRHQVLTFDSVEAFHAWERRESLEP